MKKIMMLLVAALTLSSAVTAQVVKVDVDGHKKKIAASDADILHPKKSLKATTWMNRGNVYYAAVMAPLTVFKGTPAAQVNMMMGGDPSEIRRETINGKEFEVRVFPHLDVYISLSDNLVYFWKQKTMIVENGLETAIEAYHKAVEIDPSMAEKVKPLLAQVREKGYLQDADIAFTSNDYKSTAAAYAKAYALSLDPLLAMNPDTVSAYYAGYISILTQDADTAEKYLNIAKDLGFEGEPEGEIYFLLYHTYSEKKDTLKAENALKEGVAKFPANSKLVEALVFHYTTTGQDATQMIPLVKSALEQDPDNFTFHFGLGLIYSNLEDFDSAIASFGKAAELSPDDFGSIYNLGITYIRQAEELIPIINSTPPNEQALYDARMDEFKVTYKKALDPLKRAHELDPTNPSVVELLKNIYFRFRDDSPEMMENFEKFNALFKEMQ